MIYLWAALLMLVNAAWLFLIVIGLPGTWLIVITTSLFAWAYWETGISRWTLIALVAIAALGEVMEFAAGVVGSKSAGGSRSGAIGALLGGLAGALAGTFVVPVPVIGSLLGACGGAFLGATLLELRSGRDMSASVRSGVGAGVGRFAGTVAKLVIGVALWLIATVAAFWP